MTLCVTASRVVTVRRGAVQWDNAELLQPVTDGTSFYDYIRRFGFDWDAFTIHDHYIWNSARPRTEQRTIEIRPACQQPWDDHMVVSALGLGLVEAAHLILDVRALPFTPRPCVSWACLCHLVVFSACLWLWTVVWALPSLSFDAPCLANGVRSRC